MSTSKNPLIQRQVSLTPSDLVSLMVPPRRFATMEFSQYHPNPQYLDQTEALEAARRFVDEAVPPPKASLLRRRNPSRGGKMGLYLDGSFGVGKTHLLVSMYHRFVGPKAYCSFSDLTAFVGAVGFEQARIGLSDRALLAIDEFELDDPGDTVMVAHLCQRLVDVGVRLAATSNTLPDRLGTGRFAADDFLREIASLASFFEVVRISGPDYRGRDVDTDHVVPWTTQEAIRIASDNQMEVVSAMQLNDLLLTQHPSKYRALVKSSPGIAIVDVQSFRDQAPALRFVSFLDKIYEEEVPLLYSGVSLAELFPKSFREGGFAMKYGRALSRLVGMFAESERYRDLKTKEPLGDS